MPDLDRFGRKRFSLKLAVVPEKCGVILKCILYCTTVQYCTYIMIYNDLAYCFDALRGSIQMQE